MAFSDTSCTSVKDIQLISDWPGKSRNITDEKVPSQVAYGDFKDKPYEWGAWGNLIPAGVPRQIWTKLKLDENKRPRELELLLALLSDNMDALRLARSGQDDDDNESPPLYPGKEPVSAISSRISHIECSRMTETWLG